MNALLVQHHVMSTVHALPHQFNVMPMVTVLIHSDHTLVFAMMALLEMASYVSVSLIAGLVDY